MVDRGRQVHRGRRRRAWLGLAVALVLGASPAAAGVEDLVLDLGLVPADGQPAPPFSLPTLDGKRLSLADLKGQVVLLYFWATW